MPSAGVAYASYFAEHGNADDLRAFGDSPPAPSTTTAIVETINATEAHPNTATFLSELVSLFPHLRYMRIRFEKRNFQTEERRPTLGHRSPFANTDAGSHCRHVHFTRVTQLSTVKVLERMPRLVALTIASPLGFDWSCEAGTIHLPQLRHLALYQLFGGEDLFFEAVLQASVLTLHSLYLPCNSSRLASLLGTADSNHISRLVLDFKTSFMVPNNEERLTDVSSRIVRACSRLRHLALHLPDSADILRCIFDAVRNPLVSLDVFITADRPREPVLDPLTTAIQGINDEPHYVLSRLRVLAVSMDLGLGALLTSVCARRRIQLIQYEPTITGPLTWKCT